MWDMKRNELRSKTTISSSRQTRKAIDAKPNDFQERIWLVRILLASGPSGRGQKELRKAVNLSPMIPFDGSP